MQLPPIKAPEHICIMRLSAIGDVCHALPVIRRIQDFWPETKITWIIGKAEYSLLQGIENINFIVFDKSKKISAYKEIRAEFKNLHFDILLHMQMSIRASIISLFVNADIKLGFDKKRAKDMQWLFTNEKIAAKSRQHVLDSLFGFSDRLGVPESPLKWDIPLSADNKKVIDEYRLAKKYIVISPCSSKDYRNWSVENYAAICDYITDKYDMQVVLTGGNSQVEKNYGREISRLTSSEQFVNLIGKTSLKELLAVIEQAVCVISPDSGPAHMATAVTTPVIGLYACTNPDRARPYLSKEWIVNRYPDAVKHKYNKAVSEVSWGARVKDPGTMNLITQNDVKFMLDRFLGAHEIKPVN